MAKLNDTQLVILTRAAQRDDRLVLPLPGSLDLDTASQTRTLKDLIKRKLIGTRPAARGEPEWQGGRNVNPLTLIITDAGLAAIGVIEDSDTGKSSTPKAVAPGRAKKQAGLAKASKVPRSKPEKPSPATDGTPKRVGKVDQIRDLLERPEGAGIEELTSETGWQAHSVRAALTGLRKRGLDVQRDKQDGVTRYRVAAA